VAIRQGIRQGRRHSGGSDDESIKNDLRRRFASGPRPVVAVDSQDFEKGAVSQSGTDAGNSRIAGS
jgi:hypothetical protein